MTDGRLFDADETLTVAQVNRRLGEAVKRSFAHDVWVQGQIRNLSRSARGHVYFNLCEPAPAGATPRAQIAVTLFDSNRQIVNRILTRTGNAVRIDDGIEVRIKATVELYAARGQVQLNMTSIDPEFTLGRLGADRDRLLRELEAADLLHANKRVALPLVPLRVAVITSEGSAAHADFCQQIAASRFAFELTTLSTRVQGEFAPEEIAEVIVRAGELDIDVVAIVRGGGARTDLATFDTEPVARAIAGSMRPVLCGIGHEVDNSVADLVAHATLKTPTACAQFLIERVAEFDASLTLRAGRLGALAAALPTKQQRRIDAWASTVAQRVVTRLHDASVATQGAAATLDRRVNRSISRSEHRLATARAQLESRAAAAIAGAHRRCERGVSELRSQPGRRILEAQRRLELVTARVDAVDPVQALRRGYSITLTEQGVVVRDPDQLRLGETITTRVARGTIRSTVTRTDGDATTQESS